MKVTKQEAVEAEPVREQVVELNDPGDELLNATLPVGVIGVPASMSVTFAVHVVPSSTTAGEGEQATPTDVSRWVTASVAPPLLIAW